MPKFCLEIQFELSGVLGRMGLSEAFSDSANFRKMSVQSLFISTVLHKAFIEVGVGCFMNQMSEIRHNCFSLPFFYLIF